MQHFYCFSFVFVFHFLTLIFASTDGNPDPPSTGSAPVRWRNLVRVTRDSSAQAYVAETPAEPPLE